MELTNEFVIDRPIEETWEIMNDLEFIAPCMPGAQLQEIEDDEYRGIVKIKVGPITAQYKGKACFVEQDEKNRVARLKAEGRDPRQGNANATVTAKMQDAGEGRTTVNIHTDLSLSGKLASFGRGAIEDVSKKLLGQFSDNLRDKLAAGNDAPSEAEAATAAAAEATESPTEPEAAPNNGSGPGSADSDDATNAAAVRKIDGPEAQPVDLLAVSSGTMAKRMLPAAGGLVAVAIILYWLMGRG